ncbi:MAG: hypothetical protein KBT12_04855 [Bacteroidales bacterium]|nr:hypothetical protein [Candidatus Physcousia equi]
MIIWNLEFLFVTLHCTIKNQAMSLTERATSERLIQAMGKYLPTMSFAEMEECIPLDVAFDKIRDNIRQREIQYRR